MTARTIKRAAEKLGIIDSLTIDKNANSYTVSHEGTQQRDGIEQTADQLWARRDAAIDNLQSLADIVGGKIERRQLVIAR